MMKPTLLRPMFWAAAAFAVVMASLPQPPQLPGSPNDKVQHILAFIVLGALASAAYPGTRPLKIGIGLSLLGAVIELIQAIPALHRDSDPLDWVADTAAAAAILILVQGIRAGRGQNAEEGR